MNEVIKKKRIRKANFWRSVRVGLSESDYTKLSNYAKARNMSEPSALRQMIRAAGEAVNQDELVVKVNSIFEMVYGISHKDLNEKTRKRDYTDYRHAHRYWLMLYTKLSDKKVGQISNGCDRTTVLHSVTKYEEIYKQVPYLRDNHKRFIELMA